MRMPGTRQIVLMQRTVAITQADKRRIHISVVVGVNDLRQQQAGKQDTFKTRHFDPQVVALK